MDHLINFSLKYTEIEDETFFSDSYNDDAIENGKLTHESTPENSIVILSPMMFSRQSSLDSVSTPSSDGLSVQSDYSYYISSSVSPSDIPDSPSEIMPQLSRRSDNDKLNRSPESESEDCSTINGDEDDNNLLESCLQLGIYAMNHNNPHQSYECRDGSGSETIDNENLKEECT